MAEWSRAQILAMRDHIHLAAAALTDAEAMETPELFPVWESGTVYEIGARVRFAGKLYKCVQAHTSQSDWTPDVTPALWTAVAAPGEIPVWVQPTGAQDAYMTGDRVRFPDENGDVWASEVDNNVWPPNVYGWSRVD